MATVGSDKWNMFSIFLKHDILYCVSPGPMTFLDKVSIHQTDENLKAASISKLGAFLVSTLPTRLDNMGGDTSILFLMFDLGFYLDKISG